MLNVNGITKSFGGVKILDHVSFLLNRGEKAGLVGANGCGKTTLLRILNGEEQADSGNFQIDRSDITGYLPQTFSFDQDRPISFYLRSGLGDASELAKRLEFLASALASHPENSSLQDEYDETLGKITVAEEFTQRMEEYIRLFDLQHFDPETPVGVLSGGQQMRLALARILARQPDILYLDEPTNHLDITMLEWLEKYLLAYRGAVLLVSHDREFLNRTVNCILEIEIRTHQMERYAGGYSDYISQKMTRFEKKLEDFEERNQEIFRLRQAAGRMRGLTNFRPRGKAAGNDKFARGFFADRSLATMSKIKNIENRVEKLIEEQSGGPPRPDREPKFNLRGAEYGGRAVLEMIDLAIGYPGLTLVNGINLSIHQGERFALTGPNGCGKSTLLRTISGELPPAGGHFHLGGGVRLGVMEQNSLNGVAGKSAIEYLMENGVDSQATARYILARYLIFNEDATDPIERLSQGQRVRLRLAALASVGCNFLLLDEPFNHLDIISRQQFENALSQFEGSVLVVTHDRYFIQRGVSGVWRINSARLEVC